MQIHCEQRQCASLRSAWRSSRLDLIAVSSCPPSPLELGVDQKLAVSLSGGSRATIHGKPQVERNSVSGGSELVTE